MTDAAETFLDGRVVLHAGDCREVLGRLPEGSIDAAVTDPPYELGFMGKAWDSTGVAFDPATWRAVKRVLKPGGHLLAFSAPRCVHRMAVAIEDAGFEVRDRLLELVAADATVRAFLATLSEEQVGAFFACIERSGFAGELAWVFGSGFPKSHDVSKAIDKALGLADQRGYVETTGGLHAGSGNTVGKYTGRQLSPDPVSDEAREWRGWGTALKPAYEPIIMARKPPAGTVVANVLKHGTGAVNVGACAIGQDGDKGRWPANLLHDGSAEVVAEFPGEAGGGNGESRLAGRVGIPGEAGATGRQALVATYADAGSAARFFYTAKADGDDRLGSKHPTVKPVDLMQWLVRLVCRKGGTVFDPFAGTGSTGEAAFREGMHAVLIEREAEYRADIARRMALALAGDRERKAVRQAARGIPAIEESPLFGGGAA